MSMCWMGGQKDEGKNECLPLGRATAYESQNWPKNEAGTISCATSEQRISGMIATTPQPPRTSSGLVFWRSETILKEIIGTIIPSEKSLAQQWPDEAESSTEATVGCRVPRPEQTWLQGWGSHGSGLDHRGGSAVSRHILLPSARQSRKGSRTQLQRRREGSVNKTGC